MIALCSEHHRFADGGNYSTEYLRKAKNNPPITPPKVQLPWNVTSAFIMFGGNYFVAHKGKLFSFRVDGREVFAFRLMDNGYLSVNATVYNKYNELVCNIYENDILPRLPNLGDLMCSAQGNKIKIRSHAIEAYLYLKFDRTDENELLLLIRRKWPKAFLPSLIIDKTENVRRFIRSALDEDRLCPTITIRANVYSRNVPIKTLGKGISADFRPLGYDKIILTGLDAGEGAVQFVYSSTQIEKLSLGCA